MENTNLQSAIRSTPMSELASYHQQLAETYKDVANVEANPDIQKLIAFNGYYTLDTAPGAFFAVDANMLVGNTPAPVYDISLLISLDGTTSARFPFTGSFDGNKLIQYSVAIAGFNISLSFV